MSLFLFSAFFGFVVHQLLSIIQVDLTFGFKRCIFVGHRITIRMPQRTFIACKVILFSAAVIIFVALVLIIVTQQIHPEQGYAYRLGDALTSPRIPSAVFGLLVGALTGNMVNRVLRRKNTDPFTVRDWLEVILIFFLFIMGVGGEAAVQSYAGRISEISFGATNKIAFTDSQASNAKRAPEQAGNASRLAGPAGAGFLTSTGSAGLRRASSLGSIAEKDRMYLALFDKVESRPPPGGSVKGSLDAVEGMSRTLIDPFASCLSAIFVRTANSNYVNARLGPLVDLFHSLKVDSSATARATLVSSFLDQTLEVADKAYDLYLNKFLHDQNQQFPEDPQDVIAVCSRIVVLLCADDPAHGDPPWRDQSTSVKWLKDKANKDAAATCMDARFKTSTTPDGQQDFDRLNKRIEQMNISEELKQRPYLTIAFASFDAQLGYYDAASLILDNWIKTATKTDQFPGKWYAIRARIVLAGYMEEWIRQKGDNVELVLRKYHIKNLQKIVSAMAEFQAAAAAQKINGEGRFEPGLMLATYSGDDDACPTDPHSKYAQDELELLQGFYMSLISVKINLVNHALRHDEVARSSASAISTAVRELVNASLRCTGLGSAEKAETRAAILELFARNQLNLVNNTVSLKDKDTLRGQLKTAQRAARLAAEMVYQQQAAEKSAKDDDRTDMNFSERISTSTIIETYETILITQNKLKDAERDLAQ
jgi:hypothetical protein